MFITAILYLVTGFIFIFFTKETPRILNSILIVYGIVLTILQLVNTITQKQKFRIISSFAPFLFTIIILLNSTRILSLYTFLLGSYLLLLALINAIDFIILRNNKSSDRYRVLTRVIIMLSFGIPLLLTPRSELYSAIMLTGFFLLILGMSTFNDFIIEALSLQRSDRIKNKVRINVPVIFTALLPKQSITYINNLLKQSGNDVEEESYKGEEEADLELLIHVTEEGFGTMGHVDFYFEGRVYCYGNYDHLSLKLFGAVGDGVFFIVDDVEQYIAFCAQSTKDSIFRYGLKLSDKQKEQVRNSIDELYTHMYKWKPQYQLYEENKTKFKQEPNDYASTLYKETKALFYKFSHTNFKTYFVLTTNCVKLADHIVRACGIAASTPNGIITPGAYYAYFDTQYRLDHSIVVSKKSYPYNGPIKHSKRKLFNKLRSKIKTDI